jgi:translation initiation factor 3 subunit D
MHSLSQEATFINQNFSQQVLQKEGKKYEFKEPNPFASENEEVAPIAYRYRKWKLDEVRIFFALCVCVPCIVLNDLFTVFSRNHF